MKKLLALLLLLICVFPAAMAEESESSHLLIVYFSVPESRSTDGADAIAGASIVVKNDEKLGNVEYVAHLLHQALGGDLMEIKTAQTYPLEHDELVDFADKEQEENARPELVSKIENLDRYDTILLGYPIWWGDLPMPLYTFLESYNFGAKTIIPFTVHGGSGLAQTIDTISRLQPGAHVSENALSISRNDVSLSEADVISWAEALGLNEGAGMMMAENTVAQAVPDPRVSQSLYLWEEGNTPAITVYTQNTGNYFDDPDFRPYVVSFPVPEDVPVKGAVLICAGGAFQFRSDENEGRPVAEELASRGYQSFVVNYRLCPYTQEEGALDLARAVRFVRKNAAIYGIDEKDIAVVGFSAGGTMAGEMLLNFDGLVNGTAMDTSYVPDALDEISADASADGMIYSFYGRLSVSNNHVDTLKSGQLPPTFYAYGTRDPFYEQFIQNANAVREAGVLVEEHVFEDQPHGFGVGNTYAN